MDKILGMIGLAKKAGKAVSGETLCLAAVKEGKARLLIIACDASENTKKQMKNSCEFYGVPCMKYGTTNLLGQFTGASKRAVVSINEDGFARALKSTYEKMTENEDKIQ